MFLLGTRKVSCPGSSSGKCSSFSWVEAVCPALRGHTVSSYKLCLAQKQHPIAVSALIFRADLCCPPLPCSLRQRLPTVWFLFLQQSASRIQLCKYLSLPSCLAFINSWAEETGREVQKGWESGTGSCRIVAGAYST